MAIARFQITFHKLRHDSREYGSDDNYMVSRVFFSLEEDGKDRGEFSADIKQKIGRNIEPCDIEVGPPIGYKGSFNQAGFSGATREYFGILMGSKGAGIAAMSRISIRVRNNMFLKESNFTF